MFIKKSLCNQTVKLQKGYIIKTARCKRYKFCVHIHITNYIYNFYDIYNCSIFTKTVQFYI